MGTHILVSALGPSTGLEAPRETSLLLPERKLHAAALLQKERSAEPVCLVALIDSCFGTNLPPHC